jgi:hypothetical protein
MRNTWKVILALTLALGLKGTLAQAQPLIAGNTAAFGCGPIYTSNFLNGTTAGQFYPDGAGPGCPTPPPTNTHNGRGMAVGGTEVFYTELDEIPGPFPGFGPSEFIHVANFNAGAGSGDTRLLTNPRPGSGIQDLTFANSVLYAMTGYDTQVPQVYGLNLSTGAVLSGPVSVGFPASNDSDGFAVLPNGNFLVNNGGTSCIYSQYDPTTGAFVAGSTMTVPGNVARCTGVDTDGTSLYFMTDFNSIVRTDFAGNINGFQNFLTGGDEVFIIDISLVHPVTSITNVNPAQLFFTLKTTDDIGTKFDFQVELLKNGSVVASGIGLCKTIVRNIPGSNTNVPIDLPSIVPLVSGDVLGARVSVRIGTAVPPATCSGHVTATGARFIYDSASAPSQLGLTIFPNPPATLYFHSDGVPCSNTATTTDSGSTVAGRTLSDVAPVGVPKCKNVDTIDGRGANPFVVFGIWNQAPLP